MLIVVAILLVLMGALLGFGRHLQRQAKETLCKSTLQLLVAAIEQYYDFHNRFPGQASLYDDLHSVPASREICEKIQKSLIGSGVFLDPWGRPLLYVPGSTFPVLISAGPDGIYNTADDITSK